jgi:hypothetical protein
VANYGKAMLISDSRAVLGYAMHASPSHAGIDGADGGQDFQIEPDKAAEETEFSRGQPVLNAAARRRSFMLAAL